MNADFKSQGRQVERRQAHTLVNESSILSPATNRTLRNTLLALALWIASVIALAWLFDIKARGAVMEIVVEGQLDHGPNSGFFGLTPPTPVRFTLQFDPAARDEDPSPFFGEYETPGALVRYELFGPDGQAAWRFETTGSEIQVWAGQNGFYGVTFGNADPYFQLGLFKPKYFGDYGSFLNTAAGPLFPDDTLQRLSDNAGSALLAINSYSYVSGSAPGVSGEIRYQESGGLTYTVREVVPEPGAPALLFLGFIVFLLILPRLVHRAGSVHPVDPVHPVQPDPDERELREAFREARTGMPT